MFLPRLPRPCWLVVVAIYAAAIGHCHVDFHSILFRAAEKLAADAGTSMQSLEFVLGVISPQDPILRSTYVSNLKDESKHNKSSSVFAGLLDSQIKSLQMSL